MAVLVAVEVIHGFRAFGNPWQGGDLLYHSALIEAIHRGEVPPGGPYQGLPTYYPPGFHLVVAAVAGLGPSASEAIRLLSLLWLPVLPIGTFLLARRLTGRPWVAVLAVVLTAFGGAYDFSAGRLWVNSMFMSGHLAYPLYPRDIVFGLLPFALLAELVSFDSRTTRRAVLAAVIAGLLLGLAALTQLQLLLPLPPALGIAAVIAARRGPNRGPKPLLLVLVTGLVALAIVMPWFVGQLDAIRRNGGVSLESDEALQPAMIGFWSYMREFGLLLPLGAVGAAVSLLPLRSDDPVALVAGRRWLFRPPWGIATMAAWAGVAFVVGLLYRPDLPFEDALRPQRMWLIASQPIAILAAVGMAIAVEAVVLGRLCRPSLQLPLVAVLVIAICVPSTVETVRHLADTWSRATYADLDLTTDRVPSFASLLPRGTPRQVVLTYEDWSALVWFETGEWVVAMKPPGYAKLAYDPATFTPFGEGRRRDDLVEAFNGKGTALTAIADKFDATYAILARRGEAIGLLDAAAAVAAERPGATTGSVSTISGNGWDAVRLDAGSAFRIPLPDRQMEIEIRASLPSSGSSSSPLVRLAVSALSPGGARKPVPLSPSFGLRPGWSMAVGTVPAGCTELEIAATAPVVVQSVRGFVPWSGSIPGWRVTAQTDDAVVLAREP